MSFIGGGKIVSIGNGGDGIRIGSNVVYNVSETYTAGNGGRGFVQEDDIQIPDEIYRIFFQKIQEVNVRDLDSVNDAAEKSGMKHWLAEHGIEAGAFIMELYNKAQSSDWISQMVQKYLP